MYSLCRFFIFYLHLLSSYLVFVSCPSSLPSSSTLGLLFFIYILISYPHLLPSISLLTFCPSSSALCLPSSSHLSCTRGHHPLLTQLIHLTSKHPNPHSLPHIYLLIMPYPSIPTFHPENQTTSIPIPCTNTRSQSNDSHLTVSETQSYSWGVPPAPPGTPIEYSPPTASETLSYRGDVPPVPFGTPNIYSPPTALETQSDSGYVPPAPPGTPNEFSSSTASETQSYSRDVPPVPPGTPNEAPIDSPDSESSAQPNRSPSDVHSPSDNVNPDTSSGSQSQQDSETPASAAEDDLSADDDLPRLTESFHAVNIAVVVLGPSFSGRIVPQMDPPTPPATPPFRGLDPPTPPLTPP